MGSLVLKTFSFAIVFCVAAFLVFDTSKYGSFKDSGVAAFFRDSGAQQAFLKFRHYSKLAYRWSQKNVPLYFSRARENLIPILLLAGDMIVSLAQQVWTNLKILYYYIIDKKPMAVKWGPTHPMNIRWLFADVRGLTERIAAWCNGKSLADHLMDQQVPGLTERMAAWFSMAYLQLFRLFSQLLGWLKFVMQWLKDYLFVGTPPECMEGFTKHSEHHSEYRRSSHVLDEREDDRDHF